MRVASSSMWMLAALYAATAFFALDQMEHAVTLVHAAALQCPLHIQSPGSSTLKKPKIKKTPATSSQAGSGDGSNSKENKKKTGSQDGSGSKATDGSKDMNRGSGSGAKNNHGSSSGSGAGDAGVTPKPAPAPSDKKTEAPAPGPTPVPETSATPQPKPSVAPQVNRPSTFGSSEGAVPTPSPDNSRRQPRQLQVNPAPVPPPNNGTPTGPNTGSGANPEETKVNGPANNGNGSNDPDKPNDAGNNNATTPNAPLGSQTGSGKEASSGSGSLSGIPTTSADFFTCDEAFYGQWKTLGIQCGGVDLDVAAAVQATSCVIYSGAMGSMTGASCVSICSFPACTDGKWVYNAPNGLASEVYRGRGLDAFMTAEMKSRVGQRGRGRVNVLGNATMTPTQQCAFASEDSFSSCACDAMVVNGTKSVAEQKKERAQNIAKGEIPKDRTTTAGSMIAPTSQSIAGVTVVVSGIAAVASSVAAAGNAATTSMAVAGGSAIMTIEICQFSVMINQLKLEGKSSALTMFGKQMAPSAFTFLPFGKLNDEAADGSKNRRLSEATKKEPGTGVATYARTLGIREDMIFLVTLAGVIVVMAGIVMLFGVAYLLSGLFMSRDEFMNKFFDKMIGLQVLVAILSQYTIGVTGTYQVYHSVVIMNNPTDTKCIIASCALIFMALGIIFYGFIIVKKHEDELKDMGTFTHMQKPVCQRYGALYDEYKYRNRFFFAAKMMLALVSGVATGFVGMQAKWQVSIVLSAHVIFFFYLEFQSPHHSRFVQATTSFVTIMKIATLVLTFFLINLSAGLPAKLQDGISLAIVGLNLFVLFLLMVRALYAFYKKYKIQREGRFDEQEQAFAQEFYREETPPRKNHMYQQPQQQQPNHPNPYLNGGQTEYNNAGDEIRLRSGTHMQQERDGSRGGSLASSYDASRLGAVNHYTSGDRSSNPHATHHRRNDVVEL